MTMRGAVGAAACALALLALGCSDDGGEPGQVAVPPSSTSTTSAPSTTAPSTTTTAPPTTVAPTTTSTTTVPADPFAVPDDPDDIDEAYVERVINEHNRIIGDALRIELAGGDAKEIVDRYNAVFVPEVANGLLTSFFQLTPEEMSVVREPPGDPISTVKELRAVGPDCVFAITELDVAPVRRAPPPPALVAVRLTPAPDASSSVNVTGWVSGGATPVDDVAGQTC